MSTEEYEGFKDETIAYNDSIGTHFDSYDELTGSEAESYDDYSGTAYSDLTGDDLQYRVFGDDTSKKVDATVGNMAVAVIISILAYVGYKFLWDRDTRDEQRMLMFRGIVVVLGCGATYKWYKALFT